MKPKTFKEVLSSLQDKLGGKVTFVVDNQALVYALGGGADVPDPTDEEVWLRADQRERMRLDELLRQLVKQVAKNRATFLVRRGIIDIVNRDDAEAGALLHEKVFLNVNERPLMEVLDELSDDTGLTICLDSRVGDKRKSPITAKLRNVCLEDVLVAVTESAGLKFVMLRDSVYVTTAENATRISREQRERDKTRVPAPGVREGT
jgi:hypothetical protein